MFIRHDDWKDIHVAYENFHRSSTNETRLSTNDGTSSRLSIDSSTIPAVIAVAAFVFFAISVLFIRGRVVAGSALVQSTLFGLQDKHPPQLWEIRLGEPFRALHPEDAIWEHLEPIAARLRILDKTETNEPSQLAPQCSKPKSRPRSKEEEHFNTHMEVTVVIAMPITQNASRRRVDTLGGDDITKVGEVPILCLGLVEVLWKEGRPA